MIRRLILTLALVPALAAYSAGCGDDDNGGATPVPPASQSFSEGDLRIEIETIDTGLLKGHAFGTAAEGWTISAFRVEAVTDEGVVWNVIEPEVTGIGTAHVEEFFEVVIQELPRGEQLAVEAIAELTDESGAQVERTVVDKWPP